jgi:hypothetical protein
MTKVDRYFFDNQEDSLVFNLTSLQRGLFRSTSLKKYTSSITKNQETSGDDKFMKPPPDKTIGIKNGQYDKMNEKGFCPEETHLTNGDVIFGKVTPINDTTNSGKIFKDSSEQYKHHADGVVDRVYTGIKNQDGYETRKALVRSERFPRIGDKFCQKFDGTVQVLTSKGWKFLEDITKRDLVATLVNGKLCYKYPIDVYRFDYDGKMYKLRSQQVDLDVTMDHELYAKKRDHKEFELIPASKLIGKRYKLKKNCVNIYPDIATITINGTDYDYDAYLDLMGIFIADGCLNKSSKNVIWLAGEKGRKIDHLYNVARRLGLEVRSEKNDATHLNTYNMGCNHTVRSEDIYSKFKELNVGALNKFLPPYVWKLSQRQARILLNSMISCDGSHNQQGSVCYYTSSKQLADDVMKLAIHCGWAGSIKTIREEGSAYKIVSNRSSSQGTLNADALSVRIIKTKCEPEVNHGHTHQQNGQSESTYHYTGVVGCIEVPSHVFMIRQNNKNVWIGNCSRHGQKGTMGIGMEAIDMPFTKHGIRPDIIMNPNAVPSRMTIGQLWECLLGKIGALKGMNMDGTAFEDYDLEAIKTMLENLGYQRNCEEYLYNGMTGKKLKHMIFIGPTYYQRLKHLVQDKIHCILSSTEVLTLSGWKTIQTIKKSDKVATLCNGCLEYENPTEIQAYPDYKGKMYYIKNQSVDLAVTGNHRMWVSQVYGRSKEWTEFDFERADAIVGMHRRYKKDAEWVVDDYQFTLPEANGRNKVFSAKNVDMDAWLTFFGIWYAEGCAVSRKKYPGTGNVSIAVHKQRVKDALYPALTKMGYKYSVNNNNLQCSNQQLYQYMKPLSVGAPRKAMPGWVFELSHIQAQQLIHAMILGDGSFAKNGCTFYYTSSVKLADQFQQLCLHAGWACIISTHLKAGNRNIIRGKEIVSNYDVLRCSVIKTKINPSVNHGHSKKQKVQEEKLVVEKCPVYCLTVPSGVFYVRRNGKAVWTGNSRSRGPVTILTHQAPEGNRRLSYFLKK